MTTINATLNERGSRYGGFEGHAKVTVQLKQALQKCPKYDTLHPVAREALDMIAHKMGRIINGDQSYADSWHDIAGYATLAEQFFEKEQN